MPGRGGGHRAKVAATRAAWCARGWRKRGPRGATPGPHGAIASTDDTAAHRAPAGRCLSSGCGGASYRLYGCRRCRAPVALCRRCDRGNVYCLSGCAQLSRRASLARAGAAYQRRPQGARLHAARQWAYRRRQAQKVTHHPSPEAPAPPTVVPAPDVAGVPAPRAQEHHVEQHQEVHGAGQVAVQVAADPTSRNSLRVDPETARVVCHGCGRWCGPYQRFARTWRGPGVSRTLQAMRRRP